MRKHGRKQRTYAAVPLADKSGGPGSAGQSGDTQGLPSVAEAGSESVEELVQEGQYFEAEVLLGVESAGDPDIAEVQTHESPEDDLSRERPVKSQ
jgi:hypothetical protein